tara:strand:- start:6814 stop:7191 length:378 start_codon:yes stop_codon:yes gene_type:complete
MNLEIKSIKDSSGKKIKGELVTGSQIMAKIHPFHIGSPIIWDVQILEREKQQNSAFFKDHVSGKPFQRWVHTHTFLKQEGKTVLIDQVDYKLEGLLGPFSLLCLPLFWAMFTMRQYQLRKLLDRP